MVAAKPERRYTAAEYLALERKAEYKSEYIDGFIVAMSGVSKEHDRIVGDVYAWLNYQLRESPCEPFTSDVRVRNLATNRYNYPDITVVCGGAQFEDEHVGTLLNPVLIVEVLSPSTENYDRGDKFASYRRLLSLKEYVLIAQDQYRVEHYQRRDDGWLMNEYTNLDDRVLLPTIGCTLALRDVYRRVSFAPKPAEA